MGRVITEYQTTDSNDVELARTFVYGNGIDEVLAMYIPEPNWYIDQNDIDWIIGFCDVWLCDVNDGCWDAAYNNYNDSIINFRDYAKYLDDNPWTSNLPDGKERHYYYLHDALGSVMGLVGGQYKRQADREFYLYDVYGKPSGNESAVSGNPYGFTGKRYDAESWLYHYPYRSYDPDMGRWIQADPLGVIPNDNQIINPFVPQKQASDGANLYQAFGSNPVMNIDSYGLSKQCKCGPDITGELRRLNLKIYQDWSSWGLLKRRSKCLSMYDPIAGWDIHELHRPAGVRISEPEKCPSNTCKKTVTVSGKCYSKDTVNYWLWGRISRLCGHDLLETLAAIYIWKGGAYHRLPSSETVGWTKAGYYQRFSGVKSEQPIQCKPCKGCWDDGPFTYKWGH